jgi:aspartyl-tRNA(Asn)/glutamyl-tRNA(Gln) amidotransferase subunit A
MTRTVQDAALMLNVISGPDARDWHSLPPSGVDYARSLKRGLKGLRIAYSPTLGHAEPDREISRLVDDAVKVLQRLGAKVVKKDPGFADPAPCFRVLWWCGARALLGRLPPEKLALLDPDLADVVEQSRAISLDEYQEAVAQRGALGSQMRQFMEDFDLLVTPTLPIPAFEAGRLAPAREDSNEKWVNWTPYSYPFNLTQQPAASVPCGFTADGLPTGLHVVGRMFDDQTVLAACHAYEQATEWNSRRPNLD